MADSSNPTALFISPHLDDVAFSCGGTLALLAGGGWRTVLATVFTRSVPDPVGFALACQTEKGIPPKIDYMALRREEDRVAAGALGVEDLLWLDLPEAPHRGYTSAPALFSGVREGDGIWRDVTERLAGAINGHAPELVFAPQALGAHADHLQVVHAVRALEGAPEVVWYRDAPYAARNPRARPSPLLPAGLTEVPADITGALEAKLRACAAYASQLGFQFGSEASMRRDLADFAGSESRRLSFPSRAVEVLLSPNASSADFAS